jgi:putative ABC transport system permease protein
MGASTRDIVQLSVWQFAGPVVIANLVAGAAALGIAAATVAGHAVRVGCANPIHTLHYE